MKRKLSTKPLFEGKSAWIKIVASYFVIMIFSLVVMAAVSVYSYRQIRKEIIASNTMKLELVKGKFDSTFSQMEQMWQRMLASRELLSLREITPRTGEYYLTVRNFLTGTVFDDRFFSGSIDYYIYIANGDMVLTRNNAIDSSGYFEYSKERFGIGYNEWRTGFFGQAGKQTRTLTNEDGSKTVYFIYPIPFSRVNTPDIVFVTSMNEEDIFTSSTSFFDHKGETVSIINQSGEIVISKGEWDGRADIPPLDAGGIKITSEKGYTNIFARSDIGSYTYAVKVQNSEFMSKLKPVITFIAIAILFYLIIGGILVAFAARRSYMPIKELLGLVFSGDGDTKDRNEFDIIKSEIMKNIEEYNRVKNEFASHKLMSRSIAVSELLFDRLHEDKLMRLYPDLYARLTEEFVVTAVRGTVFADGEYRPAGVTEKNLIADMLQKQLGERYIALTEDVDDNLVFVIGAGEGFEEDIEKAAESARQYLSQQFGIDICAACGSRQDSPRKLRDSYFEAVFALGTARRAGGVSFYDRLDFERLKITYPFSEEYEKTISDSICCGDFEKAGLYIKQLYELNVCAGEADFRMIQILSYDLLAMILKLLHQMENVPQNIAEQIYMAAADIGENKTEEIRDRIIGIAGMICSSAEKASDRKIAERAVKIIESEYSNVNLSCSDLAERLQVNPQYLSRLVKSSYSKGIPELISERRISEAKQMLKFGMKVERVAECTGFSNTRNFRRVFIKYVGMTPKEYKSGITEEM